MAKEQYKKKMKTIFFDIILISLMAAMLIILNEYDLLDKYAKFSIIPLIIFYYLGKFMERKFN